MPIQTLTVKQGKLFTANIIATALTKRGQDLCLYVNLKKKVQKSIKARVPIPSKKKNKSVFFFLEHYHKSNNTVHLGGSFALKQWVSCLLEHDTVLRVHNFYSFYVKSPLNRFHYGIVQVVNKQNT